MCPLPTGMTRRPPRTPSRLMPHSPPPAAPTPPRGRGPDWWLFARKFFTQGRRVASFAPSSRAMVRATLGGIDWDTARCVVELGAGTGPITAELVARARPHTRLVVVEIDPDMCGRLRARFPNADVVQGDACHLDKLLADRGIGHVDHVIGGLPLPSFPAPLRERVMAAAGRVLGPAGTFRQLTIMPLVYKRMYARSWGEISFRFVPLNLPPGGVYVCRGYRGPG